MTKINNASRREFIRRAGAVSATGAAAPMALNLSAIGSAAAAQADDYKALVCVFLFGANDHYNTYVPYDVASYQQYAQLRQTLATDRAALTATQLDPQTALADGKRFALAPQLGDLHDIWNQGNLAVVLNTGTLMAPTTKAQFSAESVPLPPKLFSHNDQTSFWQSLAVEGATSGWGGQMGDLFLRDNTNNQFTCVSVTGNAVFLSGDEAVQYQVTPNGSIAMNATRQRIYGSDEVGQAMLELMPRPSAHLIQNVYSSTTKRSLEANEILASALAGTADLTTAFGEDRLSTQLRMVARMIAARRQLGVKRQVFFVGIGTFDHHDGLLTSHPQMMTQVNAAMNSFYFRTT